MCLHVFTTVFKRVFVSRCSVTEDRTRGVFSDFENSLAARSAASNEQSTGHGFTEQGSFRAIF